MDRFLNEMCGREIRVNQKICDEMAESVARFKKGII
jgi:hypothetical protein